MRVLFCVSRFWPEIGGVERHVLAVTQVLMARGHTVQVITQRTRPGLPWHERHPLGFEIIRLRTGRVFDIPKTSIFTRSLVHAALTRAVVEFNPDIVHVHDVALWTNWWARVRHSFTVARLKSFITFHGWEGQCPPDPEIVAQRQAAEAEACGQISVGAFINQWYGTHAHELTYGGVDSSALPPANVPLADLKKAVYVGRLARDTGIRMCLEALSRLPGKPISLTVAGDGPEHDKLVQLAKKLELNVRWLPPVDNPAGLFAEHGTVFAGGYLSMLEALACGARVLAVYDNDLRRDYLNCFPHADRYLAQAGNAEELAAQLEETMAMPKSEALRNESRAWARLQTWEAVADCYERLWKRERFACEK